MDKRLQMDKSLAQVALHWLIDTQPAETVLYVQHRHRDTEIEPTGAADFNESSADYIGGLVSGWMHDTWAPLAGQSARATDVQIVWNTGDPGVGPLQGKVYAASPLPVDGGITAENMPNNVTIAVSLRTAFLGRSFHGRLYHVGLNRNNVDSGAPNVLNDAASAAIPAAYETLRGLVSDFRFHTLGVADAVNDQFPLQVVSFISAGVARSPAVHNEITTCVLTDTTLDSMRRRLPLHNRHR